MCFCCWWWWFVHKITVFASYKARLCTLLFFILEWHMLNSMGLVDIDTLDLETAKSLWFFLAAVDSLILMYGFCMIPSLNLQLYAWWPMSNFKVLVKLHFLDFFFLNQLNSTFMIFDSIDIHIMVELKLAITIMRKLVIVVLVLLFS